jgi:hypothetical protein
MRSLIIAFVLTILLVAGVASQQEKTKPDKKEPATEKKERDDEDGTEPGASSFGRRPTPSFLALAGRVVLEDGTPVPDSVPVIISCGGGFRETTFTKIGGEFSFLVLSEQSTPTQGRPAFLQGRRRTLSENLGSCTVRAQLEGFTSDKLHFGGREGFTSDRFKLGERDVGTLVLRRNDSSSGRTVSLKCFTSGQMGHIRSFG